MLSIKLQRIGKKHQPSYRLVVAPKRSKLGAPPVEDLGSYNPFTKKATFNGEKVKHWIKVGAQPTITVNNLLISHKILTGKKAMIKMKKAVSKEAAVAAPEKTEVAEAKAE